VQEVKYAVTSQDLVRSAPLFGIDELPAAGFDSSVIRYLSLYREELFFTKHHDGSIEREWRCCVFNQPSEASGAIPVVDGLIAGVALGIDLPQADLPLVKFIAAQLGITNDGPFV
jgi:hypothetical protein